MSQTASNCITALVLPATLGNNDIIDLLIKEGDDVQQSINFNDKGITNQCDALAFDGSNGLIATIDHLVQHHQLNPLMQNNILATAAFRSFRWPYRHH